HVAVHPKCDVTGDDVAVVVDVQRPSTCATHNDVRRAENQSAGRDVQGAEGTGDSTDVDVRAQRRAYEPVGDRQNSCTPAFRAHFNCDRTGGLVEVAVQVESDAIVFDPQPKVGRIVSKRDCVGLRVEAARGHPKVG